MAQLQFKPLHPALRAEIVGVDLRKPIDESTRQALDGGGGAGPIRRPVSA